MNSMREYFKKRSATDVSRGSNGREADGKKDQPSPGGKSVLIPKRVSRKSSGNSAHQDASGLVDIGFTEEPNSRWRKSMEDAHVMIQSFRGNKQEAFFGVYDGHGGRAAVDSVQKILHKYFAEELGNQGDLLDPCVAFEESYKKTDGALLEKRCLYVGTTSVTCYMRADVDNLRKLYVANCGDARAVLCRKGTAMRLSYDHKASDENESRRISEGGGQVVGKRVNGILSVSRALGDHAMKRVVLCTPHCVEETVTSDDTFLILACDGLWDVVNDEQAVSLVATGFQEGSDPQACSRTLVQTALKRGSTDNISVMVIKF